MNSILTGQPCLKVVGRRLRPPRRALRLKERHHPKEHQKTYYQLLPHKPILLTPLHKQHGKTMGCNRQPYGAKERCRRS